MKILIAAIGHYLDHPSGSAKVAFDEALELGRRGEDVWVLAAGASSRPEHEVREGVHLLRYDSARVSPWNPASRLAHQKAAMAVLQRHLPQVDVLHGHAPLTGLAALNFYGGSIRSCYTVHSPARMEMAIVWKHSTLMRRISAPIALVLIKLKERDCLRRSQVVTALSQYTIDCIDAIHGNELAGKVRLIPGWVDTSRFVPVENRERGRVELRWPTSVPIFFTLRRLVPRMGLDRLLDAVHRLHKEDLKFHLMIGGSGPLRSALEEQSTRLGLDNAVTFLGHMEEQELPLAYAVCDAFILPTTELECFGLIALEALSAGRPVLATPIGAIPEIIRKFDSSWLSQSATAEDIASLLRQFLAGKIREHVPTELHNKVEREYGRARILTEFLDATIWRCEAHDRTH